MTLHIAINSKNTKLKQEMLEHLQLFYTKKQYKTSLRKEQDNPTTNPILNNPKTTITEKLLIRAYNRQHNTQQKYPYDLIIWNGSIIEDYTEYTNKKITKHYIRQINRHTKPYDIYITIGKTNKKQIPANLNHHLLTKTQNKDKLFEDIVQTIFDNLPRCQWCNRLFKPNKHKYKYCSKKCSEYGWEENNRINNREYYKRNKNTMTEKQRLGLGSKNAYLGGTPETDPLRELQKVRSAKKSLGLKSLQDP